MSLIRQFDKKYSLLGLFGANENKKEDKKKEKMVVTKESRNPMAQMENTHVNHFQSLHCRQIQRSDFIKIDDN